MNATNSWNTGGVMTEGFELAGQIAAAPLSSRSPFHNDILLKRLNVVNDPE